MFYDYDLNKILLAQQLQAQFDEEVKKPPPAPAYVPPPVSYNNNAYREKLEPNAAPPTPQCIKRIRSGIDTSFLSLN